MTMAGMSASRWLDMAKNPSLNGVDTLAGVEGGEFITAKRIRKLSKDDRRRVQFLMNLIESVGQVASTVYRGAQGDR